MATNLSDKLITLGGLKAALESLNLGGDNPSSSEFTTKTRIDFDGSKFKVDGTVLNYKQLYEIHLTEPDFAFVVYGDRAYLLSYVQDGTGMKEMRFQSVLATTNSENLSYSKTSGIYVASTDGINITSIRITDINSENESYKTDEITEVNKDSSVWYPSTKAVVDYVGSQIANKVNYRDGIFTDSDGNIIPISVGGSGGMSNTAKSLLISILRNAVYETDQSAIISALEVALGGNGEGNTPEEPDTPADPDKTYHSVYVTQNNCVVNSSSLSIEDGAVYVASITANDGYTLSTITVTMGGIDVTATSYSAGNISITNVTGDIVVVANANESDPLENVDFTLDGKWYFNETGVQDNAQRTSTELYDISGRTKIYTEDTIGDKLRQMYIIFYSADNTTTGIGKDVFYYRAMNEEYPSPHVTNIPENAKYVRFSTNKNYVSGTKFYSE